MLTLNFSQQPLALAILVYIVSAAAVWFAGTKASHYADEVSKRTGIGGALVGMVMLGAITSLPEIGTSTTAALGNNADLAVSNLLGGVAFQIVVLAVVDAFVGRNSLTSTIPNPSTLLQAVVCILLLAIAVAGTVAGDVSILGVGAWASGMLLAYGVSILFVRGQERHADWLPSATVEQRVRARLADAADDQGATGSQPRKPLDRQLIAKIVASGTVILAAGVLLTWSAEGIAEHTGLDTAVAGLTLLAVATSLPELSTAISAVKIGRNDLAIGDVLGGNMFDLALIFFVDILYAGPPVLSEAGGFASFAGLLGIILTAIYLIGMIERRDKTIFNMGYDSVLVLIVYAGGISLIFSVATGSSS